MTEALLSENKVHTFVDIKACDMPISPFTIGFFKPVIFYSSNDSMEEKKLILEHEIHHIKSKDILWLFLAKMARVMHWFNPLAWLGYYAFENVCEYACDEWVLCKKEEDARHLYAELIVKNAAAEKRGSWAISLSKEASTMEMRIRRIFKKKTKTAGRLAGVAVVAALIFINSLTVFAYEDIKVYKSGEAVKSDILDGDRIVGFVPDGCEDIYLPEWVSDYVYQYDHQFMDDEGNIFEVKEAPSIQDLCTHNYVSGGYTVHEKNSDGSCNVYYYEAQRCTKCGTVIMGEMQGYHHYNKCPH